MEVQLLKHNYSQDQDVVLELSQNDSLYKSKHLVKLQKEAKIEEKAVQQNKARAASRPHSLYLLQNRDLERVLHFYYSGSTLAAQWSENHTQARTCTHTDTHKHTLSPLPLPISMMYTRVATLPVHHCDTAPFNRADLIMSRTHRHLLSPPRSLPLALFHTAWITQALVSNCL